ncbi:MAG TPA: polysaccharide deacetylase family protein [Acidimicrobiales bacterium]|nr:polysaccharide deacetylase family protein [Acidimicrobiales bacterium]
MTTDVRLTVDVEDWYDGMAVLGHAGERPAEAASGLEGLTTLLREHEASLTFFVVGNYASVVRPELAHLVAHGHEIASHGPDHGRLPEDAPRLLEWLRRGREMVEQLVQVPVRGFRSPRFDVPESMGLARYRGLLAEAGYDYVSDTRRLGDAAPITELPVFARGRFPVGGGSYQRILPTGAVTSMVDGADGPVVLYYHSYDFGATLPPTSSIRSFTEAKQLIGRSRIATVFASILSRYGSRACGHGG